VRARASETTSRNPAPDNGVTTRETRRVGTAIAANTEATASASKRACSGATESATVASTEPAAVAAATTTRVATTTPATVAAATTTVLSKGGGTCDQQNRK